MPQAKKQQFVVTGKNDQYKNGDIVSLEVGDDGQPVSELMRSRVKPYRGKVQASEGGDAQAQADKIIEDAKAQAAKILDDAGAKAEKIITDAHASTGKK